MHRNEVWGRRHLGEPQFLCSKAGHGYESPPSLLPAGSVQSPYKRVVMFVDNAGADVVLGMLPLARELLKMGAEVGVRADVWGWLAHVL